MPIPAARLLTPENAAAYTRLRSAMLLDVPHAFGASPGEGKGEDPEAIVDYLSDPHKAIVVIDHPIKRGEFAAAAGIIAMKERKMRHRAGIWGVYCVADLRGRGYGRAVMVKTIEHACEAWPEVETIGLSASAESPGAIALYESLGFRRWGLEPDALRIDGRSFDEVFLSLRLERG